MKCLWPVFLALLAGGAIACLRGGRETLPPGPSSLPALEAVIRAAVSEPGRRDRLIVLGREVDRREKEIGRTVAEFRRHLRDLNRHYDVRRERFEALHVAYSDRLDRQRKRLAKRIVAMQSLARREEWRRIGGALGPVAAEGFGLTSGEGLKDFAGKLRERVRHAVADDRRRDDADRIAVYLEKEIAWYAQALNETASRVTGLVEWRGATMDEFDLQFSSLANDTTGVFTRSMEARYRLRDLVTRGEWARLFPREEESPAR